MGKNLGRKSKSLLLGGVAGGGSKRKVPNN